MNKEMAFVFPGQGSQKVGMGRNLYNNFQTARRTFEEAEDVLHKNLLTLCFNGPETSLNDTRNTQPAILAVSIAALRVLGEQERNPDQVAGHSLGEYSALVAVRALNFPDALRLVSARAEYMADAGQAKPGKMAAILGLSFEDVKKICQETGAEIANINTETQIVIAGNSNVVEKAVEIAKKKGKAIVLNVSIASHSSLMEDARQKLADYLQSVPIQDPQITFVANVSGTYVFHAEEVRSGLVDQITGSVLWLDTIRTMIENRVDTFVEVGPGKVLSGIIRNIDRQVKVESVNA